MSRKRKSSNKELPKHVYQNREGEYHGKILKGKKQVHYSGICSSPEEAEYKLNLERYGHHWGPGLEELPFGFIYEMVERRTGRRYIGLKQVLYWNGPTGGFKVTDRASPYFDEKAWKAGRWETYTSSSSDINELIDMGNPWDFKYRVLRTCKGYLELHIAEISYHVKHSVLEAKMDNGEYLYFNKNIGGKAFRAPFDRADLEAVKAKTAEEARNYYLKPDLDGEGRVIPFGTDRSVKGHTVDNGRDFNDIR